MGPVSTAVTFFDVILFLHITAVIIAFGPIYAYGVFLATAERTDPRALPAVGRGILAWDRIAQVGLLVILVAGVYLVSDREAIEFSDFYVGWGFLAVIVAGGLMAGYFTPRTKRLVELAERDIAAAGAGEVRLSDEFHALSRQLAVVGTSYGVFVVLTVYVMTAKPFL